MVERRVSASLGAVLALGALGCVEPSPALRTEPIFGGSPGSGEAFAGAAVSLTWSLSLTETAGCSGTLIARQVVLTAAHCVREGARTALPEELDVIAGAPFRHGARPDQHHAVAEVHVHPGYPRGEVTDPVTGVGRSDDVALLVLVTDAPELSPTRVLDPARAPGRVAVGLLVRIAGYGLTDTDFPNGTLFFADTPIAAISEHEILVGGPDQPDTCYGDSGGPTFVRDGVDWALIGVTSRGRRDGTVGCGDGSIQVYAPAYFDWIVETTGGRYSPDAGPRPDAGPGGGTRCSATPARSTGGGWLVVALALVFVRRQVFEDVSRKAPGSRGRSRRKARKASQSRPRTKAASSRSTVSW